MYQIFHFIPLYSSNSININKTNATIIKTLLKSRPNHNNVSIIIPDDMLLEYLLLFCSMENLYFFKKNNIISEKQL